MTETRRAQTKKGTPSWQPTDPLKVRGKEDDKAYRWVKRDADRIAEMQDLGWQLVDTSKDKASGLRADGIELGKELGTRVEKKGMILMQLPKELAEARKEYYQGENNALRESMTEDIKRQMASKGIEAYTPITVNK